jgi:hypothetical protein
MRTTSTAIQLFRPFYSGSEKERVEICNDLRCTVVVLIVIVALFVGAEESVN